MTAINTVPTPTAVAQPRVVGNPSPVPASGARTGDTDPFKPVPFRPASAAQAIQIDIKLTGTANRDQIEAQVSTQLKTVLEIFHGKGKADDELAAALASTRQLLDAAAATDTPFSVQIRVAGLFRSFGETGPDGFEAAGSITQLGLEVGVARDGKVAAEDVRLLEVSGKPVDLDAAQRRTGVATGLYARQEESARPATGNESRLEAVRAALDRIRLVQDALVAYRRGDNSKLREVERLFSAGSPGSTASEALAGGGTPATGAVFPGVGVIGLRDGSG